MNIEIYTDGSCRASGIGGVGIVWLVNGKFVKDYSKRFENVTNNIMELKAIGKALASIKKPIESLTIYTDSEYSIGVLTNSKWNPKKNVQLINEIKKQIEETQKLVKEKIVFKHVKGHADNEFNNKCDKLATNASNL
jgi:ribonuclease HI